MHGSMALRMKDCDADLGREWKATSGMQNFLTLKGSGYRRERKGSPLANIFRQWCDASELPCIAIEQGTGDNPLDTVVVDFVTLRRQDLEQVWLHLGAGFAWLYHSPGLAEPFLS